MHLHSKFVFFKAVYTSSVKLFIHHHSGISASSSHVNIVLNKKQSCRINIQTILANAPTTGSTEYKMWKFGYFPQQDWYCTTYKYDKCNNCVNT